MRFRVPQFIETEEKVIGPFTFKQFLWVGGGIALVFIIFQIGIPTFFKFALTVLIIVIAGIMAFYRIDGMALPEYLARALSFLVGPKRYYFKKKEEPYPPNLDKPKR